MDHRFQVTPGFCLTWALLLLLLPIKLILAALAAACVHEVCHCLAVRITGGRVLGITARAGGMVMDTTPMEPFQEILCALAGPAGSLLLVLLLRRFPLAAACALVQGCFNLLPLYPLDGGRAVNCILHMAGHPAWMKAIEWMTLAFLLWLAIRMGPVFLLAWGILAMRKIPCKDDGFGVQ